MNGMTIKDKLSFGMAIFSLVGGFVLLFMSFLYPPEGEVDSSVLYAFGEILLFAGSISGLSVHLKALRERKN